MSCTLKATETTHTIAGARFEPARVNVRVRIAALWTSLLFVFAYVDLFGLYRPDQRADLTAGKLGEFTVDQPFLVATTIYVLIPCVMLSCALILRPRVDRMVNIALSGVYTVTIVVSAIGEWGYYVLGSAVEVALLAAVAYHAWTWPRSLVARGDS